MNPIYPHARPTAPVQLFLLSVLSVAGLAALWLAAFHAFLKVASPVQAFFAASLIEAGMIIEALALVKRSRVWYVWLGVGVSLTVSATYNYIQAAGAAPLLNWWQLGTLALGPLVALCFVSLTLGYELREYQARLEKWQTDRAAWLEQRRQEAEAHERQLEAELQARLERIQQAERERQEREAERRYQAAQEEREWQRKQQELTQRRQERESRLIEPAKSQPELARSQIEIKESQLELFACQHCGTTSGKNGSPFRTQAALNAHQAHCPGSTSQIKELVVNGKAHL